MTKRLLSVREAAGPNWLNCNPKTVYRLARRADFPALRVGEKRIMIPVELLEKWIQRQAEAPLD
ncbi:MAG TPA: helix-turn-helix domain-containing protein [Corynebacteriales bacterium]|nr:helix-turn-helix domain-containing protein [Mycobacteriales bacterium]